VRHFASYVGIDWSGAKGRKHKGIAIAEARGAAAPRLIRPGHVWSREEVLAWLLRRAASEPTLFGFDFSFAPPIIERGEYLPGERDVPRTAREFWAYVDSGATTRTSAPRASSSRSIAGISISESPTG
jgi:hypothetical protein